MAPLVKLIAVMIRSNLGQKSGHRGDGWGDGENGEFLAAIRAQKRATSDDGDCPGFCQNSRQITCNPSVSKMGPLFSANLGGVGRILGKIRPRGG